MVPSTYGVAFVDEDEVPEWMDELIRDWFKDLMLEFDKNLDQN